jgi:hypothetical protein
MSHHEEQLTKIHTNAKPKNRPPKTKTYAYQQPATATSSKERSRYETFERLSS